MKLLDRIKASLKHKHEWQEDQWGKRCQVCGRVRTKKFEMQNAKLSKGFKFVFNAVYFALAISVLILVVWKGIDEQSIRHALVVVDTNTYWIFLYIFVLLAMMMMKHLLLKEEKA
jgi:hypothetical protein